MLIKALSIVSVTDVGVKIITVLDINQNNKVTHIFKSPLVGKSNIQDTKKRVNISANSLCKLFSF